MPHVNLLQQNVVFWKGVQPDMHSDGLDLYDLHIDRANTHIGLANGLPTSGASSISLLNVVDVTCVGGFSAMHCNVLSMHYLVCSAPIVHVALREK